MRGAELLVVEARFVQAEFSVYRGTDVEGIVAVLAVVFPPADRAKLH